MRPCPVQLAPGPSHQPSRRDDDCSPHGRSLLAIHTPQRIRHIFQPRGRVHHRGRGCGRRRFAVPKTLCFTCFSMDIKLDSLRQRAVTSGSARQTLHINNQTKRPPPRFCTVPDRIRGRIDVGKGGWGSAGSLCSLAAAMWIGSIGSMTYRDVRILVRIVSCGAMCSC